MPDIPETTTSSLRIYHSKVTPPDSVTLLPAQYSFIKVRGHEENPEEVEIEIPGNLFGQSCLSPLSLRLPAQVLINAIRRATYPH